MSKEDEKMPLKVGQLYQAISSNCCSDIIRILLKKEVDLNWIIPAQYLEVSSESNFDCTLLHIAYAKRNIDTFQELLQHGANFTIKYHNGSTILHHIFQNLDQNLPDNYIHLDDPFVELGLCAQSVFEITYNPCDMNGLSHFHFACMANYVRTVTFFLVNGISVDESVSVKSSVRSGYTPLHFAAEFCSYETAELLISNGADMNLKNGNGMTALHLLITERLKMFDSRHSLLKEESVATISKKIEFNEQIINLILMNDTSNVDVGDSVGLTNFHVACTFQDSSVVECLLDQIADINHSVRADSPVFPGYTALHFAAHCSVKTVKLLIEKGADLTIKDKEGVTPLDICMRWFKLEDVHSVFVCVPTWKGILFSGTKIKLINCILAMKNPPTLKRFLEKHANVNMSLSTGSSIWPGFTPLHLAVKFSERLETENKTESLVQVCLDLGANIHAQDKRGWTPLHLAFRENKQQTVNCLLKAHGMSSKKVVNLSDEDGLSYLHMSFTDEVTSQFAFGRKLLLAKQTNASAVNAIYKGEQLLKVKPGWTPLHVAASMGDHHAMSLLLKQGANILQTDCQGFTAVHRLFGIDSNEHKNFNIDLIKSQLEQLDECVVKSIGLTHLHVVSWFNKAKIVQLLLDKGSNVEATIRQTLGVENHLEKFVGCTPLHVAMMNQSEEAVKELLQWGADIFAKKADSASPLSLVLTSENRKILKMFVLLLQSDDKLQKLMKKKLGLTMLHIACHMIDIKNVKALIKNGTDVNAKIRNDSNVWPGCTALHVLMMKTGEFQRCENGWTKIKAIFELLLANGAGVTVTNTRNCSPLQLIFTHSDRWKAWDFENIILKRHLDYEINPTDNTGLSYFHLACLLSDLEAVEKFLQQDNLNVNQQTDFFLSKYGGYTPLHLALSENHYNDPKRKFQLRIVKYLLEQGAKISMKCSRGCTPLHILIQYQSGKERLELMKLLLEYSNETDLNVRTIEGKTPIEMIMSRLICVDEMKLLIDHGANIKAFNPITKIGYIANAFTFWYDNNREKAIAQIILKSSGLTELDEMGRSALHNSVSAQNVYGSAHVHSNFISELIKLDCDIDHQDKFGQTALHLAVQFRNEDAVKLLLNLGADLNIIDSEGRSAFFLVFEPEINYKKNNSSYYEQRIINTLAVHVEKCKLVKIEVSKLNDVITTRLIENSSEKIISIVDDAFLEQVQATENVKIGRRELTLRSFLCETGAISIYPSITPIGRNEIAKFFENIDNFESFPELKYIFQLQYRKAVKRLALISPAGDALKILLGFPLPDLCAEIVLMYLSNSELKNLIAASIDDENNRMDTD